MCAASVAPFKIYDFYAKSYSFAFLMQFLHSLNTTETIASLHTFYSKNTMIIKKPDPKLLDWNVSGLFNLLYHGLSRNCKVQNRHHRRARVADPDMLIRSSTGLFQGSAPGPDSSFIGLDPYPFFSPRV